MKTSSVVNYVCVAVDVCQCHALGANGSSCDPVTRQCMCKPDVGGLKCDRCNPNFWGLPKIAEGNNGCIRRYFGCIRKAVE